MNSRDNTWKRNNVGCEPQMSLFVVSGFSNEILCKAVSPEAAEWIAGRLNAAAEQDQLPEIIRHKDLGEIIARMIGAVAPQVDSADVAVEEKVEPWPLRGMFKVRPAGPSIWSFHKLVERMRLLELDHDPEGWPSVRMKDIANLCNGIDALQRKVQMMAEQMKF